MKFILLFKPSLMALSACHCLNSFRNNSLHDMAKLANLAIIHHGNSKYHLSQTYIGKHIWAYLLKKYIDYIQFPFEWHQPQYPRPSCLDMANKCRLVPKVDISQKIVLYFLAYLLTSPCYFSLVKNLLFYINPYFL